MTTRKRKENPTRTTERIRRPNLDRRVPIRDATNYLRDSGSWPENPPNDTSQKDNSGTQSQKDNSGTQGSFDDVVTQGVKLGYKVIEQYITQGQRVAEQISQPFQKGVPEAGTADVVQGMVRLYKDMADVCGNALDLMVRNPVFWSWLGSFAQNCVPHTPNGVPGTLNGTGAAFSVEIASARPTEVMLNVEPSPQPYTPFVHALHAPDRRVPPLTSIAFQKSPKSNMPVLLLKISSKQPSGIYTGVVVDKDTNKPKGTLTVRVLPAKR
jgi:hypothetical protein